MIKHPTWKTFFSIPSWIMLGLGLLVAIFPLITDGIYALFSMEVPYHLRANRASCLGFGLILFVAAPWFTRSPILHRLLLSLCALVAYFMVFLVLMFIAMLASGLPVQH